MSSKWLWNRFSQLLELPPALVWQAILLCFKGILSILLVEFIVDAEEAFLEIIGYGKLRDAPLHDFQRLCSAGAVGRAASG